MTQPRHSNFVTGSEGLIAVDKIGNKVMFLDPLTYDTILTLGGFAPRVHELAISPDRKTAFAPIYGDGKHGANPNPGHLIAVFDLPARRHIGDFSTAPYVAPHTLRWGAEGQLYCVCENSGVVLEMDAKTGKQLHVIPVGSNKAHRIEVLPDGSKLYTENEEDSFASVVDLRTRERVKKIQAPSGLVGLAMSPDGKRVILVDATEARVFVVDTQTDEITGEVELKGHKKPAQIARYSPNGKYLVVTSHDEPLATIFNTDLSAQQLVRIGQGPMDMAFHLDGRTVLIGNQDEGTIAVVDLEHAEVLRTVKAGEGVEALCFY